MRIGVFGGTFDPVHLGHLILAEQCREQGGLDQVRFIPAARPPHKQDRPLTPFHRRVEMLRLAIAGHPAFVVDELENERAGPSYTVETLGELHRRHPEAQLHLLIGADCLPDLPNWLEPVHIVQLAKLLVAARPGWPVDLLAQLPTQLGLANGASLGKVIDSPLIDIRSHDLRQRAMRGRSLRYLVPRAVECYIETHRLYQKEASAIPNQLC
jgi:nicotinate-nucleotide adenylyltransferase